ncbi:MAG: hypothetical protein JJ911_06115 [Rhizobiaceae bacterium]|nr:hypothetical protein [Rhizobiaceae bacterium]
MNRSFLRFCALSGILAITTAIASADQAECEATVRAIMAPYGENAPEQQLNRFGTSVTKFGEHEMRGYSLQTAEGSLYFDADKNPASLSFVNGDVYTSMDQGKTWTLANSTPKEVMETTIAGIVSQAEKATNITCEYGVDLNGKTVNHYAVDYEAYNTGTPTRSEYWVDAETGFVWRDTMHSKGDPEMFVTVDAEPAPDMTLPDPKG